MESSLADPMHLFKATLTAALLLAALSCGGGKIPPTRYYVLDLPPAPAPKSATSDKSLAVRSVGAADPYNQDRIVYRPSRQEVGFYEYHRWAADPRESIQAALIDKLAATGLFKAVASYDGRLQPDYLLQTRIERLEEVDFESGVQVYVEVGADLIDASDGAVIWSGDGKGSGTVTSPDVAQVVSQMSAATAASLDAIVQELTAAVQELTAARR